MTFIPQEVKVTHTTLWEEAKQLGIVDTPYPGPGFARLIQRKRFIQNVEKFRNGTEEERREVQEFFNKKLALYYMQYALS
jgi:hypothetical protein